MTIFHANISIYPDNKNEAVSLMINSAIINVEKWTSPAARYGKICFKLFISLYTVNIKKKYSNE